MNPTQTLLAAIRKDPGDWLAWAALADALEEQNQPGPAELLRLDLRLRKPVGPDERPGLEARLRELLDAGVRPFMPTLRLRAPAMRLVLIPPGSFLMGSPPGEEHRDERETQHPVTLTRGFYLGVHPVTQAQYRAVMPHNPSHFSGDDRPVENVRWERAVEFCRRLTRARRRRCRLPTEAEWEYACRAGTTTPFHFGTAITADRANFDASYSYGGSPPGLYRAETTPVGSFAPNAWGLYDLHGNVWEWTADRDGDYPDGPEVDPARPGGDAAPVMRGGSWFSYPWDCRSAYRSGVAPGPRRDDCRGFRVLIEAG